MTTRGWRARVRRLGLAATAMAALLASTPVAGPVGAADAPATVTVTKDLAGPRNEVDDQFTLTVSGPTGTESFVTTGDGAEAFGSATTSGPAGTFGVRESGPNLIDYVTRTTCVDATGLTPDLPVDEVPPQIGADVTFEAAAGAVITCTVTNTPPPTTIEVVKELAGPRVDAADQFEVWLTQDVDIVAKGVLTTGTGATIDPGTGRTGAVVVDPTLPYSIYEISPWTELSRYTVTATCIDANQVTPDLPVDQPLLTFQPFTVRVGAAVTCTITNTPTPPRITVVKELGGPRVVDTDQFQVTVRDEAGTLLGSGRTFGSGSTPGGGRSDPVVVTPGEPYTIGELGLDDADLSRYLAQVSCYDLRGYAVNLPTSAPLGDGVTVTLPLTADVLCTITNTPRAPTIELEVGLASARRADTDQFTIGIATADDPPVSTRAITPGPDGPLVSDPTNATSTGAGDVIDPGTGTTGAFAATAGQTYVLGVAGAGTTDLARYRGTLTCVDTAGLQPDLPSGAPYTGPIELTPVAGARLVCAIAVFASSTAPVGDLEVTKGVVEPAAADANGRGYANYRVTVENRGGTATTYDLVDELAFGAGIDVVAAEATATDPVDLPVAPDWDGVARTDLLTDQVIAAGATHVVSVVVEYRITAAATASSLDCTSAPDEVVTGLGNTAAVTTDDGDAGVFVCAEARRSDAERPPGPPTTPVVPAAPGPTVTPSTPLARTGTPLAVLAAVGVVLSALGLALTGGGRRRRAA